VAQGGKTRAAKWHDCWHAQVLQDFIKLRVYGLGIAVLGALNEKRHANARFLTCFVFRVFRSHLRTADWTNDRLWPLLRLNGVAHQ
jgi:hypothetical protein